MKEGSRRHAVDKQPADGLVEASNTENRFYVECLPTCDAPFEISGPEALHAAGSRRMRIGDSITLFDGSGYDLVAEVVRASARQMTVEPISRVAVGARISVPVVSASALPKGSRGDALVAQCAQLGVTRFVPVDFERSVVRAASNWAGKAKRFRRLAIEAAKQSGQSTIMELAEPVGLAAFLEKAARGLSVFGMPRADESVLAALESSWPFEEMVFLVGPEGGIAEQEAGAATEAGWRPVRLGATTLRIETACAAFASVAAAFLSGRVAK